MRTQTNFTAHAFRKFRLYAKEPISASHTKHRLQLVDTNPFSYHIYYPQASASDLSLETIAKIAHTSQCSPAQATGSIKDKKLYGVSSFSMSRFSSSNRRNDFLCSAFIRL